MKEQYVLVTAIAILLLSLSACATKQAAPITPRSLSPRPEEVQAALAQVSPERKVSALKALRDDAWPPERQLDLQGLITFESLEIVPRSVGEREVFQEESTDLAAMVKSVPLHNVSMDIGALLYLAGKGQSRLLPAKEAAAVDRMCMADFSFPGGTGDGLMHQAMQSANEELAASCRFFIEGDLRASQIALSQALKRQLSTNQELIPSHIKPSLSGGWDIFKYRLEQETGLRLDASETRLMRQ